MNGDLLNKIMDTIIAHEEETPQANPKLMLGMKIGRELSRLVDLVNPDELDKLTESQLNSIFNMLTILVSTVKTMESEVK